MRVKSRKPPAAILQHLAVEMAAEIVGGAHDRVGDQMRQVRGDGEDAVVVGRVDALDLAAQRLPEGLELVDGGGDRCRAAASGCASGPGTDRAARPRGRNSRCRPPDGPARNARPRGCAAAMSAITVCFTEPTSETMQPGLSADAIALVGRPAGADRRADDHEVGVLARLRRDRCRNGRRASACWRAAAVSALRVAATIVLGQAALARLQRDRAADQADADQRDLVEQGFAHLLGGHEAWRASRAPPSPRPRCRR